MDENLKDKWIVMTTINPPTEAVVLACKSAGWNVVVVGDKKTPPDWHFDGATYLSATDQESLPFSMQHELPWNLPARVMVGYLYAMQHGAKIISQIDDDNIMHSEWAVPPFDATYEQVADHGFVNIYKSFTDKFIWPRGYPLDKILSATTPTLKEAPSKVGVWQHLADGDTDVDAIYRLTNGQTITFNQRAPVVLTEGTVCPYNCQSTTYRQEVFPLLYLPAFISPRESDIVRGLIAQPILWAAGYTLGFTAPTVRQDRNIHNYLKDFAAEMLIYLHSEDIFKAAQEAVVPQADITENLYTVYKVLADKGFIPPQELPLLSKWIEDTKRLTF
jgi:hypothetical protein